MLECLQRQRPEEGVRARGAALLSYLMWVLRSKLRRAASILNHWAISPAQTAKFLSHLKVFSLNSNFLRYQAKRHLRELYVLLIHLAFISLNLKSSLWESREQTYCLLNSNKRKLSISLGYWSQQGSPPAQYYAFVQAVPIFCISDFVVKSVPTLFYKKIFCNHSRGVTVLLLYSSTAWCPCQWWSVIFLMYYQHTSLCSI